jgi:endoglucanase
MSVYKMRLLWICMSLCMLAGCGAGRNEESVKEIEPSSERMKEESAEVSVWAREESVQTVESNNGSDRALHVEGSQLVNAEGEPVQLKGISTHGLAWFPEYVNEACFRQLKEEWQADVIRLAMYTAEYGGYCSGGDQAALKELVKKGVEYATDLDLYVIIDWHILSDGNPNLYVEEAKAFFAEMAALYTENDHVLYEICNEPNGGTTWEEIKAYAAEVIPVIRAQDAEGIIIVGTPNWSQFVGEAAADPIAGYDNIMYALHFYAATHTDELRHAMTEAVAMGLPVFVTEYGICDASGSGAIDEQQANQWVEAMDASGVSYVAWNLSNKNETSAMIDSGCSKTSGFAREDLSPSGRWVYDMLQQGNK